MTSHARKTGPTSAAATHLTHLCRSLATQAIDNTCPADATASGASLEDQGKEKLEWKDVFELTEWFRPGTLKKQDNFDPNAGIKSM